MTLWSHLGYLTRKRPRKSASVSDRKRNWLSKLLISTAGDRKITVGPSIQGSH